MRMPKEPDGHPELPFDLEGYTCFSLINCPLDQARQLVEEYDGLCALEHPQPFTLSLAALPAAPDWTAVRWPRPASLFDLLNLTMWLMGYRAGLGGENPICAALPPAERAAEGPMLARPEYDNPFGDEMLGLWQGWSFDYQLPGQTLRWIGEDTFPMEYFFQGRGYSETGFQLEWLEQLERIPGWVQCTILLEG